MRLLTFGAHGEFSLTKDLIEDIPSYAILSHTWGSDEDEVTMDDLNDGSGKDKLGYIKIQFCMDQARKDGLQYSWVDTCNIDKRNSTELQEAITSMFRWYHSAVKCYVYLSDVSIYDQDNDSPTERPWESAFRRSRWFGRGWTLQELLAPKLVEFFSREGKYLGDRNLLEGVIHDITNIPIAALRGRPMDHFSNDEKMRWTARRRTKRVEDRAYCLLGIFGIFMYLNYGEGENSFVRLKRKIGWPLKDNLPQSLSNCPRRKRASSHEAGPRKQAKSSLASLGFRTQEIYMSDDRTGQQHLARIYTELAENRQLLLHLLHVRDDQSPATSSNAGTDACGGPPDLSGSTDKISDQDSGAVNFVFDCISRFSRDKSNSVVSRLQTLCSGSPDYYFESKSSFFPEEYWMKGSFNTRIVVNAIVQSPEDPSKQTFFLTYSQQPRRWQRIIISTRHRSGRKLSEVWQSFSSKDPPEQVTHTLPKAFHKLLDNLLPIFNLDHIVTAISMTLLEDEKGRLVLISPCFPSEFLSEAEISSETQRMQDIKDMGCALFSELQVIHTTLISSQSHAVLLGSQPCIEEMIGFVSPGGQCNNEYERFFQDLKLLRSLQGCSGIPEFIGVVLDEKQDHLKGFLYESPFVSSIEKIMTAATSESKTIEWPIREFWARKIIEAISAVHKRGSHLGTLELNCIGLRADGTPLLTRIHTTRKPRRTKGFMPPELRQDQEGGGGNSQKSMTFRTDVFQLGYILWFIAEQKPKSIGYLCARSACTNIPRFKCTAEHANPVELPACGEGVPSYFNDIIRACRSSDPKSRPTVHQLAKIFADKNIAAESPPGLSEFVQRYSSLDSETYIYCDECCAVTTDCQYHCYICTGGDFDICPGCFAQGIRCFVPEHHLIKRIRRNGQIVDGS